MNRLEHPVTFIEEMLTNWDGSHFPINEKALKIGKALKQHIKENNISGIQEIRDKFPYDFEDYGSAFCSLIRFAHEYLEETQK